MKKWMKTASILSCTALLAGSVAGLSACVFDLPIPEHDCWTVTVANYDDNRGKVEVSAPAETYYSDGELVTVTVTAYEMFEIASFTVNGLETDLVGGQYSFEIYRHTTITVDFESLLKDEGALLDSIEQAEDGDTIVLGSDITLSEGTLSVDKDITLDLGGYTLSNAEGQPTATVAEGATLTIKGEGTIENTARNKPALYVAAGGTATVEGGTFKRVGDGTTATSYYTIENYGDLTINGGVFAHEGGALGGTITLVANKTGATMVINGGEFSGMNIAVKNEKADLVINGGTFDALDGGSNNVGQSVQNQGTAVIKGGTFERMVANLALDGYSGNLTIEGGIFNGKVRCQLDDNSAVPVITVKDGKTVPEFFADIESANGALIKIEGGLFHEKIATGYTNTAEVYGKYEITGGKFEKIPANSWLPAGHIYKWDPELKVFVVSEGAYVMNVTPKTGGKAYSVASFAEAIAYLQTLDESEVENPWIYMWQNVTDNLVVPAGVTVALYFASTPTITNATDAPTVTVQAGGTLIPHTSIGASVITNTAGQPAIYVEEGGIAYVQAVTATSEGNTPAIVNEGTLYLGVEGGTGMANTKLAANHAPEGESPVVRNAGEMYLYGGTYNGTVVNEAGATATLTGGTISGDLISETNSTIEITNAYKVSTGEVLTTPTVSGAIDFAGTTILSGGTFATEPSESDLADGFRIVENANGTWSVTFSFAVFHNDEIFMFATIEEAFGYLNTAETKGSAIISIRQDVSANVVIPEGWSVTLNLNGFTLTNKEEGHTVTVNGGNLTLSADGTVSNSGENAALYVSGGNLTMSKGTISGENLALVVEEGGTVKISGGTVLGNASIAASAITLSAGTFGDADHVGAWTLELALTGEDTVKISGGTFYHAVEFDGNSTISKGTFHGNVTLKNGTYKIETAFSRISSSLSVANATFNGTVVNEAGATTTVTGGKFSSIVNRGTLTVNVSIVSGLLATGGTYNGQKYYNGDELSNVTVGGTLTTEGGTTTITDGTFTVRPSDDDIAEGYEVVENDDGTFTVSAK